MVPDRLQPLVAETAELASRFEAAGHRLYFVGGVVRDLILNQFTDADDFDFTTDARPDEIERLVSGWADAVWTQGKRFGTIGFKKAGRIYEVTTFRAEAYQPDSRKPDVRFADDLAADLARRDFTVNAMALSVPGLELTDPFGGVADLAAKRLRTPLDPAISFTDDPLRMLRAARFIAGYDMEPEPELVAAVAELHGRLSIVSAERIRDELDRLVTVPTPVRACGSACTPDWPESSCPNSPRLSSNRTPSTVTRTCSPTPSPSSRKLRRRTGCCAWRLCSTTSANPAPGRSPRGASPSTTMRWSGPA